ncbi:glycine betaine ABC transporter substrate-binding protein [Tsukamurella sp. 8F]|uniref:glycine betaine ABC transporter substrate-binding protein n=1 Tax=unclassified Tsukamurella TaxID=2633480 RepID=UPI0023B940AF|nr:MULTISPECIES: glycine betaine ABC transporter substrate-binding protein [unclassified Tsukamurella]MDF0530356.1 glycine betaine ABC transporter substrate-binding protein [Tsukamurella sp. 8J]MDF0587653.1 glycine betaine ABC transporter substrate-binding protein [Tsukamurella sp. 8F]
MMRRSSRAAVAIVLAAVLATTGACGLHSSAGRYVEAESADGKRPLEGAHITVTSKVFTEGVILGKMTVTLLAAAGAKVDDLTGAPGSMSARKAQTSGRADVQWEYTGTGWVEYLKQTSVIADPKQLWQQVHDKELANGLTWLEPANFNDTYAFAMNDAEWRRTGIRKMSDIAKLPPAQRTWCIDAEFFSRPDGFKPMLTKYGMPLGAPNGVPQNAVNTMDSGVVYTATAAGRCLFGEVYTTDGRIKNLNLHVLEDDRKYFLPYSGTPVVNTAVLKKYPQIEPVLREISSRLSDSIMQDLNGKVDIDGEDPATVAADWLRSEHLIR